jgi:hypothetical protein
MLGWNARDVSLVDRVSGASMVLVRAGNAAAFASDGLYYAPVDNAPRFIITADGSLALLLEVTSTQVLLQNRNVGNAAWTRTNMTAQATVGIDGVGVPGVSGNAKILGATAGNATAVQAVTLGSSSRIVAMYAKRETGTGAIQMSVDGGSTWTTIGPLTAAYARYGPPAQTLANPSVGIRIVTNGDKISVDMVTNETGTVLTSPMAATTVAVTRAAETAYFPFLSLPQAMSIYVRGINYGTAQALSGNDKYWSICDAAGDAPLLTGEGGSNKFSFTHDNAGLGFPSGPGSGSVTNAIAYGDEVEALLTIDKTGLCTASTRVNGGAVVTGTPVATGALAPAWAAARFYLNSLGGVAGTYGRFAFKAVGIAQGAARTMDVMAQAVA